MFGVVSLPLPKLAVLYKCLDCGHKCRFFTGLVKKECPCCGGENLRLTVGMVERKQPPWVVN